VLSEHLSQIGNAMPWYLWVVVIYLVIGFVISFYISLKTTESSAWEEPGDDMAMFIAMTFLWLPAGVAMYFSDLRLRKGW
jgi:hypothetical protein